MNKTTKFTPPRSGNNSPKSQEEEAQSLEIMDIDTTQFTAEELCKWDYDILKDEKSP
jgi:hypothetical protein